MLSENLVIPVQICDELPYGQGEVWGQTDRQAGGRKNGQAARRGQQHYPFGLKCQKEKNHKM